MVLILLFDLVCCEIVWLVLDGLVKDGCIYLVSIEEFVNWVCEDVDLNV